MRTRQLKNQIRDLLSGPDLHLALKQLRPLSERQVVNPLFSLFYNTDERLKWRAVTAMGDVVARLAEKAPESARVVMRRLMWNLNDESGGIGWGSPEAMGEIMARHDGMAREYAAILISYADPCGNYLEHELLQRGLLWGLGRLAHARPERVKNSACHLPPYMQSGDPSLRGLALWVAAPLRDERLKPDIRALIHDPAPLNLYQDDSIKKKTVGELAREALARFSG